MMKLQQTILLVLFVSSVRSQLSLESCTVSLQCGSTNGLFQSTGTRNTSYKLRGPPGERGPRGYPGQRGLEGESAEQCECNGVIQLQTALQQLEARLTKAEAALNPTSCSDVMPRHANDTGGVYTIYPITGGRKGVKVFCDLVTNGGGWLVFQKREDGSENFSRSWDDYVNGFGKLHGEFWLGLEKLHQITSSGGEYEMRIDMEDFEGNKTYAAYGRFSVGEGGGYRLNWENFSGPAGNGMTPQGTNFTTKDNDQDTHPGNCATEFKGGWWFTSCHAGNPNGFYYGGPYESYADGVSWYYFRGHQYSLKIIEMKIRKK